MTRFEKWSVLATSAATAVTGVLYLGVKYLLEPADPWAVINHPLQPWLLKAHILVAPLLVFAVGMIAVRHVWQHFRRGLPTGRRSGILTAAVFAPMVLTGYLIQSVTAAGWLQAIAWAHIGSSLAFAVGVALHAAIISRRASASRGGAPTLGTRVGTTSQEHQARSWRTEWPHPRVPRGTPASSTRQEMT